MLLLLQHSVKFLIKPINNFLKLSLLTLDLGSFLFLFILEFPTSKKSAYKCNVNMIKFKHRILKWVESIKTYVN